VLVLPGIIFNDVGAWDFYLSPLDYRILWAPTPLSQYEVHISPLESFARFERNFSQKFSYEARLALNSRSYLHVGRGEDSLRVFFEETTVNNVFKFSLSDSTSLEVSAGYAFNRFLYEGKQVFLPVGRRSTMPSDFIGGMNWRFVF
jgi:hypothetical protein